MSNADKLFYELGYEKEIYMGNDIFINQRNENIIIEFDNNYNKYKVIIHEKNILETKLIQAINMKCLELGWIDKETQQLLKYADNPVLRMC